MGNIQDNILKGSYKGVRFNFTESSVTDGGNTIIHSYVNSNKVDFEIVGRDPRNFNMSIYISGNGSEYFANRESLEAVLVRGAGGEFVHPIHGKLHCVVDGPYTLTERITKMGRAFISVRFTVVERVALARVTVTPQKVFNQAEFIASLNSDTYGEAYKVSSISALEQSQNYINDITTAFQTATELIQDPTKLGEFTAQLLGFQKGGFTNGVTLLRDIIDLYGSAYSLIETAEWRLDFFSNLFGFGDDEVEIPQTTRTRVEQAQNQKIQRVMIQSTAVVYSSAAGVDIDYKTDEDLNNTNAIIQTQFAKVLNDEATTQEQYNELQSQRVNFTEITKDLTVDVSRIIEIEVNNIGLSTLIYQYYGITEDIIEFEEIYKLIISLNGLQETGNLSGTIRIVTQQGEL